MNDDQHSGREPLDLLALGAAGALSDDEYRTLDELIAADPELAREYAELQMSAAMLAEASSEAPPPQLRASVLEAIRGVDQLPGPAASAATAGSDPESDVVSDDDVVVAPPVEHHRPSNVVPIHHRRWMVPATAAAAVVMLLVGGLIFRRVADAPADQMAEVLNDDDAVTIPLDGTLSGLRLITSDREDAAVLMGSGLEQPDTGLVFQLWAIHDEQMVGMGTFMPAATGEVALFVEGAGDDAEWAVTVEPEGGSDQPTSAPVAVSPGLN
jgi:anti-sigma-K factor RskA